jgi:hypothetical protein
MQLKIQRSQRTGLVGKALFCVDIRADYSMDERVNINRYALGGQTIYNSQNARKHLERAGAHLDRTQSGSVGESVGGLARGALSLAMAKMSLNITIASLGRGHHIECKELPEMLEAEETVRNACKNLTRYLDAAATFDGSEMVVEYLNGEERMHIMQNAPPLLEYAAEKPAGATGASASPAVAPNYNNHLEVLSRLYDFFKPMLLKFEMQIIATARDFGICVIQRPMTLKIFHILCHIFAPQIAI